MALAADQCGDRTRGTWRREGRHDGVDRTAAVAEHKFYDNDRARDGRSGWCRHAGKMNSEGACTVGVDRIDAGLLGVETGDRINGRGAWRRASVGTGEDDIHLRETADAIEMGHGDALTLNDGPIRDKDLAGDRECVVAMQGSVAATVIVRALRVCLAAQGQAEQTDKDCRRMKWISSG